MALTEKKLAQAIEIVESAIADFRKLKPFIGDAAEAAASLYEEELKKITQ